MMKCFVVVLSLAFAGTVSGGGLRLVTQDAFAGGRAEAFAATASNASAIYYNPAGLGFLDEPELRLSAYILHFEPTFQNPDTNERFDIEENLAVAPSFFYSHPIGESDLSFGLGLYAPYGAAVEWPEDTGFWSVAHAASLTYLRMNPVVAWRVSEELSLAAGLFIDYGEIKTEQGLAADARDRRGNISNLFRFKGDGWTVGYNLGAIWRPNQQWSLGLNFRSGTSVEFEGETDKLRNPIPPESVSAKMELDFPLTAVFGISWRPNERWNIEYNADYTRWSSFDRSEIQQGEQAPQWSAVVPQNVEVNFDWKDSWIHSIGVTRQIGPDWHASLGYAFSQNSVSDKYYNPLVADLDRHFVTLGIGRRGEHWDFDVAYQHGFANERRVRGSEPATPQISNFGQDGDGDYDFTSHAVAISVAYRF